MSRYNSNHGFSRYIKQKLDHITTYNRCNSNHCKYHFNAMVYQRFEYLDWLRANTPNYDAFTVRNNLYHKRQSSKPLRAQILWYSYHKFWKEIHDSMWSKRIF